MECGVVGKIVAKTSGVDIPHQSLLVEQGQQEISSGFPQIERAVVG